MRSALVALALWGAPLALCASPALSTRAAHAVNLPDCTVVAAETVDAVDSGTAHPGDLFRLKIINAVTDTHRILIPPHELGWGVVSIASPAGRGGRAGTLVLEPLYLILRGGQKLGVVLDHRPTDLAESGSSNSLPGYLGAIPVPGMGAAIGAFNYFRRGKNIVVPKGTIFAIFPSDDPRTARCQRSD
jgi:hypothetical protein